MYLVEVHDLDEGILFIGFVFNGLLFIIRREHSLLFLGRPILINYHQVFVTMSCAVISQSNPLAAGPIVVTCTAPVAAPVPIPIPAHIADPVPLSVSIVAAQSAASLTVPVRPAFNWRNTTDRLREGLHWPLPFESDKVRRHRQSVFQEMGLSGDELNKEDDDLDERDGIDEILPRSRHPRPASGIFLTNVLRLGFEDDESSVTASSGNLRKRMSWSPATGGQASPVSTASGASVSRTWSLATTTTTTTTATSTSSSGLSDRKRPWYAKLGGGGSMRLARNRSILSTRGNTK